MAVRNLSCGRQLTGRLLVRDRTWWTATQPRPSITPRLYVKASSLVSCMQQAAPRCAPHARVIPTRPSYSSNTPLLWQTTHPASEVYTHPRPSRHLSLSLAHPYRGEGQVGSGFWIRYPSYMGYVGEHGQSSNNNPSLRRVWAYRPRRTMRVARLVEFVVNDGQRTSTPSVRRVPLQHRA
jgi:hypothetical protein